MIRSFRGKTPCVAASAFVSEAAYLVGDVFIGEDVSIFPGAVLRGDMGHIHVGAGSIIEDNCVIHSGSGLSPGGDGGGDIEIGCGVQIGHGAVLNCRRIGDEALIGMNATVLHGADIGAGAVVAAACLVPAGIKVPEKTLIAGVPGKLKGPVSERQAWWTREGAAHYPTLLEDYRSEGL